MRLNPVWVLCLLLPACARDPIDTPGTWRLPPKGLSSNDENLRAMLVNPHDLVAGTGESTALGVTAARAARKLLTGTKEAVPNASTTKAAPQAQQQGAATGASAREE